MRMRLQQLSSRVKNKHLVIRVATSACKRKTAVQSSSSSTLRIKQSKGQVSKETFHKLQWTCKREHQSMVWPCTEMDDQDN